MTSPRRLRSVGEHPLRYVCYVRVSALMGREGDDFHSPDLQLAAIRRAPALAGHREVAIVQDIDVSGRTFDRKGLDEIRRLVEAGQVDIVAVYDYSRLGRNVGEAATFIQWLTDHNVSVLSANEPTDTTTPEGRFILNQFLGMAQLFSDQMGRRWSEIIASRARDQGLPHHSRQQTGYIRQGRFYVEDPVMGPAVACVIRWYADGKSLPALATYLGALRGKSYHASGITSLCTNPFYVGLIKNNDQWFPGVHKPLIDEATHLKALARARRDADMPPRSRTPAHSLSGLIWCGECEGRAKVHPVYEKGRAKRVTLLCSGQIVKFPKTCDGFGSPHLAHMEERVLDDVRQKMALLQADVVGELELRAERARLQDRRDRLQEELVKIANAMGRLTARWSREQIPEAVFHGALAELRADEAATKAALDACDVPEELPDVAGMIKLSEHLLELWPDLNGPERGQALRSIVSRVTIHRGEGRANQYPTTKFRW